jgi:hypothetical protein
MILGMKGTGFSQTVVKIFIAGILINFSLFFCKVIIDTSNLVSIQFYNAITPTESQTLSVQSVIEDGGLSNTFMQSLKIPSIYSTVKYAKGADISIAIIVSMIGGVIMMIVASISFFAASIAFVIRTGLLLFAMTLSPLYFAGMIFPKIKSKVSEPILGMLISQCLFMPIYLFLLYIALKIITDSSFMDIFKATSNATGGTFGTITIGIAIQYIIALIFINAPLVAAIEFGGKGMGWAPQLESVSKSLGGMIGRNTLGRWSGALGSKFDNMAAMAQGSKIGRGASTVLRAVGVSQAVRGGLRNAEKSKYGSSQSYGDVKKENKDRAREIAGVQRTRAQTQIINSVVGKGAKPTKADIDKFKSTISDMNSKEIEGLDNDTLFNVKMAASLSSKQVENLLKSDKFTPVDQIEFKKSRFEGLRTLYDSDAEHLKKLKMSEHEAIMKEDFTGEQKKLLSEARKRGYEQIIASESASALINNVLKGKPGDIAKLPPEILTRPDIAILLDPAVLKNIVDENVGKDDRQRIRNIIQSATGAPGSPIDKAKQYLNQNFIF